MEMEVPSVAALAPATTTPPSLTSTTPTKPSLLKPPLKRASPGPHMADVASSPLLSSATSFDSCSSEGEEAIPAPSVVKKGGAARKGGASAEATGAGHAKVGGRRDPGRWTTEEHMLFLKGLEIYGKSWKKISDIVKTRTVVQIRTHAQKYLIKLEKAKKVGITTGHGLLMMDGKAVTSLPPTQPQQLPKAAVSAPVMPPKPTIEASLPAPTYTAPMSSNPPPTATSSGAPTPAMPPPLSAPGVPPAFNRGLPMPMPYGPLPWLPNHFLPNGAPLFNPMANPATAGTAGGMGVDMGTSAGNAGSQQQQTAPPPMSPYAANPQAFLDFTRNLAATMPHLFTQPGQPGAMQPWQLGAFPAMQQLYQFAAAAQAQAHHQAMMSGLPTPPFPNMAAARAAMMNPAVNTAMAGRPPRVAVPPLPVFTPQPAPPAPAQPATTSTTTATSAPAPSAGSTSGSNMLFPPAPPSPSLFNLQHAISSSANNKVMSPPARPAVRVGLDFWSDMAPSDEEDGAAAGGRPHKRRRTSLVQHDVSTSCSPLEDLELVLGDEPAMDSMEEAIEWERFGSQLMMTQQTSSSDRPSAERASLTMDAEMNTALDEEILRWFEEETAAEGGAGQGGDDDDDDDLLSGIELGDEVPLCSTPDLSDFAVAA